MSDIIHRQDAIQLIQRKAWLTRATKSILMTDIALLPSARQEQQNERWIPCTEQLPEVFQWVLVSTDYDVDRMYLTSGGYWSDGVGNLEAPGYALAWMPLPERWKGEK